MKASASYVTSGPNLRRMSDVECPSWVGDKDNMGYVVDPEPEAPRTNTREFCQRCQRVSAVGFSARNDLWKLVAGPHWEWSILCIRCFAELGDEKGVKWEDGMEFYPVSYVTLATMRADET